MSRKAVAAFGRRPRKSTDLPVQVGQAVERMCQASPRRDTKSLSRNLIRKLIHSFQLIFCFIPQRRVKVFSIEYLDEGIFEACKWVGIPAADRLSNRKDSWKRKQEVGLRERRRWRCVWLPEGRLAACAACLYISRHNVIVYDPHRSAPCSVPQRMTCTAASAVSLALWHLCSAMGCAGQTPEGGS